MKLFLLFGIVLITISFVEPLPRKNVRVEELDEIMADLDEGELLEDAESEDAEESEEENGPEFELEDDDDEDDNNDENNEIDNDPSKYIRRCGRRCFYYRRKWYTPKRKICGKVKCRYVKVRKSSIKSKIRKGFKIIKSVVG